VATAEDVLALARSQIGVAENPLGSNRGTPYHAWFGAYSQGWQWCAIFVAWLFHHTDPALVHGLRSAYSGDYLTVGRRHGEEVTVGEPGDIVVFDWGDGGITDHIGIVESRTGNTYRTIEGNVNDRVGRVTRARSRTCVMWFVRPKYAAPKKEEDEMSMMFIPPQAMPKQEGLYVWDFVEGFTALPQLRDVECWLNLYNESPKPVDVHIYTSPPTGARTEKLDGWTRRSIPLHKVMSDCGVQGGFSTIVKSASPNIVSGITIFGR